MASRAWKQGSAILIITVVLAMVALSLRPSDNEPVWLAIVGRVVPLILLIAGVAQSIVGRPRGGVAATLAGLSLAGLTWTVASVARADPLLGVGMLVGPLLIPWLVLQVADLPSPWRPGRIMSPLVVIAFVGIGLTGVVRALVYEPLLDLNCGPFCGHSPVAVMPNIGLAMILEVAASWTTIVVCACIGLGILIRLLRLPAAGLRASTAALLTSGAMAALASASVISLILTGMPPTASVTALILAIQAGASIAIATAVLIVVAERLAVRRSLAEVARLLDTQRDPQALELVLGRAVGDPELRIGFWTDDVGYVDAGGLPIGSVPAGRKRTELTSRGLPIAVLVHDDRSVPADLIDEQLGPQARLALQNKSLQLQLRRHVEELRASRRRIVEVADAERRGLERDLHDGAQQLLLALSFELRRGERAALSAGDEVSTALFGGARDAASRTLEQLRILAHGIHPSILTGAGLEDALLSYASRVTPSPVLRFELAGRLPEETESALYAIVTGLISGAPGASVSIRRVAETVRVTVDGSGDAPEYVLDRVGAAGGSSVRDGQALELILPCV